MGDARERGFEGWGESIDGSLSAILSSFAFDKSGPSTLVANVLRSRWVPSRQPGDRSSPLLKVPCLFSKRCALADPTNADQPIFMLLGEEEFPETVLSQMYIISE